MPEEVGWGGLAGPAACARPRSRGAGPSTACSRMATAVWLELLGYSDSWKLLIAGALKK